VKVNVV